MWDYDKLFAVGNIIGIKNSYRGKIFNHEVDTTYGTRWLDCYKNEGLCDKGIYVDEDDEVNEGYTTDFEIQYIIRLDGHGNVVEKLFDREKDIPKPMPELETGMFVRVAGYDDSGSLGFIDVENNHIIYQSGGYDYIKDKLCSEGVMHNIIEVYDKSAICFDGCRSKNHLIWKDPKYKACS